MTYKLSYKECFFRPASVFFSKDHYTVIAMLEYRKVSL